MSSIVSEKTVWTNREEKVGNKNVQHRVHLLLCHLYWRPDSHLPANHHHINLEMQPLNVQRANTLTNLCPIRCQDSIVSLLARDHQHRHSFELVYNREVLPVWFSVFAFVEATTISKHTKLFFYDINIFWFGFEFWFNKWLARERERERQVEENKCTNLFTCWSGPTPISIGVVAAISLQHASNPCLLPFYSRWVTWSKLSFFCKQNSFEYFFSLSIIIL